MELALKTDVFFQARANEGDFWRVVGQNYCNINRYSEYIHSCSRSTYLYKSGFSFLNVIKAKQRNLLKDFQVVFAYPKGTTSELTSFFSHCPFNAKQQAGKQWLPI